MSRTRLDVLRRREPLRIGFLPFSDCAPLVYAQEAGLFEEHGLDVHLQRETRCSNLSEKVISGELDAAEAPATVPFLAGLGIDSDPCACVSALVLSLEGDAILVSRKLWEAGVHDAATFKEEIHRNWGKRTYTLGVTFSFSCQEILLRRWLLSAGILPETAVRVVAVPPDQMFPTVKLGYIDGCCAGEPWASLAVQAGVAMCVATSADLAPAHPEKVLMVRQSFAAGRREEHERLLAALLEACAFCDQAQNRGRLGELLAHPQYVNAPVECFELLENAAGATRSGQQLPALSVFARDNANDPTDNKARWLMQGLYELLEKNPFLTRDTGRTPVLKNVFRRDIFERAKMQTVKRAQEPKANLQASGAGLNQRV